MHTLESEIPMKKFIRMLEEQGVNESLLKLAPFALAKYRRDSYDHLNLLCSGEKKLMAAVLSGVIVLWLIKKFNKRCQEDLKKNKRRDSFRELNQYLDSIQLVARLDMSIDQQALRAKAVDWLLDRRKRRQALSSDLKESKLEHQKMLGQLIDAIRVGTRHSENAIHRHLSEFLNSIRFTTLDGKPFTRRNISR
jgi:hypothetical protein